MGGITFQKRQKEMKRQEKQRMKAEKRAQRKDAKIAEATALALGLPYPQDGQDALDPQVASEETPAAADAPSVDARTADAPTAG